jgi:peptidoglycan/xylan/chitin deacetylase (PgdA/CDA1 family)
MGTSKIAVAQESKISFGRLLKLGISIAFFCACTLQEALFALLGFRRKGYCVVLYYHAVAREDRALFSRQMDLLLRWAKPIAADSKAICQPGERCVALTFDDGLESVIENALPELVRRQIPSTIFVVPESLGQFPIWMASTPASMNTRRVMSQAQLRNLHTSLVTIGSHSLTHPNLTKIGTVEARRQICDSRNVLREMLGEEVSLFSFPYGAFNEDLVAWCREAGYSRVFTTIPSLALMIPGEYVLGRVGVETTDWPLEFGLKLWGAYRWLPAAFALKRKVKIRWSRIAAREFPMS